MGRQPAAIIEAAEEDRIIVLISEDIVAEIAEVLTYPKLEKIYSPKLRRKHMIEQVLKIAKLVKVKSRVKVIEEHPADNKFLECALSAKANYIVSGDKHVLKVLSYKQIKMLSVSDFLKLLE